MSLHCSIGSRNPSMSGLPQRTHIVARVKGKYDSKLMGSEEIAEATRAFHFEKPGGFAFKPGESIDLFLPEDFPGASDDRQRSFSLASAPHEDRLTIATRMRKSAYKEPLAAASPGARADRRPDRNDEPARRARPRHRDDRRRHRHHPVHKHAAERGASRPAASHGAALFQPPAPERGLPRRAARIGTASRRLPPRPDHDRDEGQRPLEGRNEAHRPRHGERGQPRPAPAPLLYRRHAGYVRGHAADA